VLVNVKFKNLGGKVDSAIEASVNKWLAGGISGAILKDEEYRKLWKVSDGGRTIYIKKFIHSSLSQRLRFKVFKSKARREFENLSRLRANGVNVPAPLGLLEGNGADTSIIFLQEIKDARTLREYLNNEQLDYLQKKELLAKLAELVRASHKAGLENEDLHSGNILIDRDRKLYLIDIHRARFRITLLLRERVYELAFLIHSFYKNFTLADIIRFLQLYFEDGFNEGLVQRVFSEFRNIRRKWWSRRSRNCLKVSSPLNKDKIIQEHLAGRHVKNSHNRSLSEVENYFVKEYRCGGLKRLLCGNPAKRAWYNAYALTLRDIPVPKCYKFCEGGSRSFIIGEWLDALPLGEFVKSDLDTFDFTQRKNFLFDLARILRRMHIRGVVHNDMKANNVFVKGRNGGAEFYILDFDDVYFTDVLPLEVVIKNLAQLNASVRGLLTIADRMRFLRYYIGRDLNLHKSRKLLAKDVISETIKRENPWQ